MSQTDNDKANWFGIQIRKLFSLLDKAVYSLLIIIYQIFFNVASATILQGDTLKTFFGRIQIILGIFVLFKLAINLLNVIVNPDQLGNDKSGQGFTQVVVRVVLSLVMLVAVMPLNIPNADPDTYEAHLNANGLLFGTLYEFQDRILEQNTLAKLILGSAASSSEAESDNMKEAGNQLATLVLKGFVRINMAKGKTNETDSANWMCPDQQDAVKTYLSNDATPNDILDIVTLHCKTDDGERFVFTHSPIIGAIVGALFVILIIGFTLDIAIRAIKLAVLRLISPIPIISYIDPKSSKDGAFASWTKAVMTTYLDLFLRLAIVYFVIYIIQDIMVHGIIITNHEGPIGTISVIFIFLGLLYFAKQAPKFITTTLGIKSAGLGGVGTSGALGFLGGLVGGGGLAGATAGAMTAANTASEAAAQGKAAPSGWTTGRDLAAKLRTGDEKATGGILNTAQRHLMQHAKKDVGTRRANALYGINTERMLAEKQKMYDTSDEATRRKAIQERVERSGWNSISDSDKMGIEAEYRKQKGIGTGPLTADQHADMVKEGAIMYAIAGNTAANIQKGKYEKMEKIANSLGVMMTPDQEYRASLAERAGNAYHAVRHPVAHHRDTTPQRQNLHDRILGRNDGHGGHGNRFP